MQHATRLQEQLPSSAINAMIGALGWGQEEAGVRDHVMPLQEVQISPLMHHYTQASGPCVRVEGCRNGVLRVCGRVR
jgi:hypothetical protein